MTTRRSAYIVTLAEDQREGEDKAIISALRMVKGVLTVKPVPADDLITRSIAEDRADMAWRERIGDLLREKP